MKRPWLLAIGACWLFCCASAQKPKDQDLRSVLDTFCHNLRWQFHELATARVDPRYATKLLDQLDDAKEDLHITAWEIRRIEPLLATRQAKARVQFSYYRLPSTVVRTETVEQLWQEENGSWTLLSQSEGPFVFPPKDSGKDGSSPDAGKGATRCWGRTSKRAMSRTSFMRMTISWPCPSQQAGRCSRVLKNQPEPFLLGCSTDILSSKA
jgi:hypothetical protein